MIYKPILFHSVKDLPPILKTPKSFQGLVGNAFAVQIEENW
jgi:hypothetical protein